MHTSRSCRLWLVLDKSGTQMASLHMTTQQADDIVVETPSRQRWRLAGIGLIMTAVSAALVITQPYGDLGLVAGIAGLVFFGPLMLALLSRAIRRTPALILSPGGFTDRSTLACGGFVPWHEVKSIQELVFRGRVFVAVTMKDQAVFRRRLPAWRRLLLVINQRIIPGDVLIPESVLPVPTAELVRMMRSMRRQARH